MRRIILSLFLLLALFGSVRAQNFRFAQLTDVHLYATMPSRTEDLMRSIEQINATEGLDFVLITGDITCDGDRATMLEAKRCFDLLRYPYHVVLGNHETKWSSSGCTAWQEIFGEERRAFTHKGVHFLLFNTGPLMRMMYGHVAKQDLDWLETQLKGYPKDEPVVAVSHYPLLPGDVDNWFDAESLLGRYNVRLFIGGHYHRTLFQQYGAVPGILMRANYRDGEKKVGYGIYEVTPDSIRAFEQCVGEEPRYLKSYALRGAREDFSAKVEEDRALYEKDQELGIREHGVKTEWEVQTGVGIYCSPCEMDGKVFVGDDEGVLTAYRLRNGKKLWSFRTGARIVGSPAAADGMVVVGSADGCVYGVKAKDGRMAWKLQTESPVLGAVVIRDGKVYVGTGNGTMFCLLLECGCEQWRSNEAKDYIETKPLLFADNIVYGAWDNKLYCLSREDGSLRWKWIAPRSRDMHYSPAAVWPVETDGRIFIADPERALTAIDAGTGETIWRSFQSKVRETVGLSEDGERVYSKTMQDSLVCYSSKGHEPQQLWATDVGFGYEIGPCMPQEKEGTVYGSSMQGLLFALHPLTGKLLWRHQVGHSLVNTVVPLPRHRLLYTDTEGHVGLLRHRGGGDGL